MLTKDQFIPEHYNVYTPTVAVQMHTTTLHGATKLVS